MSSKRPNEGYLAIVPVAARRIFALRASWIGGVPAKRPWYPRIRVRYTTVYRGLSYHSATPW
jgi:hypothetical protein